MSESQEKVKHIPQTTSAFLFDDEGYLSGAIMVQESPLEPGVWLMPENATRVKPALNNDYFCRFNVEKNEWEYEKKPVNPEDFDGLVIDHYKQTPHCKEMRNLIQTIVNQSVKTHKIKRGPNMEWMTEQIPQKTPEELQMDAEEAVRAKRDYLLAKSDYLLAADYPISAEDLAAVKTYRQALRDVPQQSGFPDAVEWPEAPQILQR